MDLRQLRYLLAVVEAGSFSAAARQIHIVQPALTRQIRALEESVGATLLHRQSKGVSLTAAGQSFVRDITYLFEHLENAAEKARRIEQGYSGELMLGVTAMHLWVPGLTRFLKTFRTSYPGIMLKLNTILSGPQITAIRLGQLDAGLLFFPPEDDDQLETLKLYTDHLVLVTQSDSRLAHTPPRRLADLGEEGFIWFDREMTPNYHDQLIGHFQQCGFTPNVIEKGNDNTTMLSLVASGIGCTVLPRLTLAGAPPGVVSFELEDLRFPLDLMLTWRRDRISPVTQNLIDLAREHVSKGLFCTSR